MKIIKIVLLLLVGILCLPSVVLANDLNGEINFCNVGYAGNSCVANIVMTNNTDDDICGILKVDVRQELVEFDGVGFDFNLKDGGNWLSMIYNNGTFDSKEFCVLSGTHNFQLEVISNIALVSDNYTFELTFEGEESKDVVIAITSGGGGGYLPKKEVKQEETKSDNEPVDNDEQTENEDFELGEFVVDEIKVENNIQDVIDEAESVLPINQYIIGHEIIKDNNGDCTVVFKTQEKDKIVFNWFKLLFWFLLLIIVVLSIWSYRLVKKYDK